VKNLYTLFLDRVERHAGRLAIEFRPRYRTARWTYSRLGAQTGGLAQALAARDIGPGDRVLLYAVNSPHWAAAYFAILARGAIVVALNPQSAPEQLDRICASAEPRLLLRSARRPWPATPLASLEIEGVPEAHGGKAACAPGEATEPGSLAEIVYTSGTTGEPKGVMLTHANLIANLEAVAEAVPISASDHVISLLPLFHMYGQMTSLFCPLWHGSAVTYLPSPSSRVIRETLAHTPATHLVAIPEILKKVMDRLEQQMPRIPTLVRHLLRAQIRVRVSGTLHTIVSGGASLDPEVERKWWALGLELLQGYGLTETSPIISSNTRNAHRTGSVGRALRGVELRLSPDGEIWVQGPNVTPGYFHDPARTREAFEDGWFRTGDAGRLDAEGFLYVFGRKKYMILGGSGENIYPEDLEAELNKVPGVRDSAVVGLDEGEHTIVHAVLLGDDCDGDAVIAEANRHLAPHQQILRWSRWHQADFPRSATRKVRKEDVIHWLRSCQDSQPKVRGTVTQLTRLIAEVTKHDPQLIHDGTRIVAELGLDSLSRIELVSRIEEALQVSIEEHRITAETTVADLETHLRETQGPAPRPTRYPRWSLSACAAALRPRAQRLLFFSWLRRLGELRVRGLERLADLQGPMIFMANHRSFLDAPWILRALPAPLGQRLGIAAAPDVLYAKFWWFAPLADLAFNSYPFPTESEENIKPGLEYTGRLLDDGWNVLVFPEGQLNRGTETLQALKGGAGVLAVEMQVPVVPVAILGTEKIMPPDTALPHGRGRIDVRFGAPIRVTAERSYAAATRAIEDAIRFLLQQS
jgi:long-chain acyl-CoA synthetase